MGMWVCWLGLHLGCRDTAARLAALAHRVSPIRLNLQAKGLLAPARCRMCVHTCIYIYMYVSMYKCICGCVCVYMYI